MVRQLFEVGIAIRFWHQFAMTAHSPVGLHPEKFGVVKETEVAGTFANNDNYIDSTELTMRNLVWIKEISSISCMESVLIIACRNGLILKFQKQKSHRFYFQCTARTRRF
jgi:hypothetical protein